MGLRRCIRGECRVRLNKYIAEAGLCSRREADRRIESGRVTVDGQVAGLGTQVEMGQIVCCDGVEVAADNKKVVLICNKPRGIVCTAEKKEKDNIIDYIGYPIRVFPVGRLDKDSRGLILLTNDGELSDALMRSRNGHEREYEVTVDKAIDAEFVRSMSEGVYLEELDVTTLRAKVKKLSSNRFSITLTQGLNRQIRRMCEALGYRVRDLKRVRIENLMLGDLEEGRYRELSENEERDLRAILGRQ